MIDRKKVENVEYFNYFGTLIANDARRTREIQPRTATVKVALNMRNLVTSKLDLNLRKKLVNCCIWN